LNLIEKDQLIERVQKENIETFEDVGPNVFDIILLTLESHE
jgi:hypothetical protein